MRKKLPLISGILNVLEKLKGNTGIIENTSVATHTIAAGKYVIWKNDLYKASSAISIGDTLSLSNLTAVSDGIANALNDNIFKSEYTLLGTIPADSAEGASYTLSESVFNFKWVYFIQYGTVVNNINSCLLIPMDLLQTLGLAQVWTNYNGGIAYTKGMKFTDGGTKIYMQASIGGSTICKIYGVCRILMN